MTSNSFVDLIYKNEQKCLFSGTFYDLKAAILSKCQPEDLGSVTELLKKYVLRQTALPDNRSDYRDIDPTNLLPIECAVMEMQQNIQHNMFPILGDMSTMMGLLKQQDFPTTDLWLEHIYQMGTIYGSITR
eukprot:CAMPEP_0116882316 /NCGR_PEP_ID=MMETSP0463-20121206/14518_1 /TAXON_ID=181622 /ORGANISM="Strombidinopsis sp, Strain SopsisLIS2011" /LENGTH=130 /DNA_ID=CAMNT_0004535319 /DNA_START=311 /DNA_END=703 /DNA_ORIENTATION=-